MTRSAVRLTGMRLTILEHGHRRPVRLFFATLTRLSRVDMSDVPKALLYRPEFAGRVMLELSADTMRGPSYWTPAEREYLGMRVAKALQCPYCAVTHEELVRIAAAGPFTVSPELQATVAFVEQLTTGADPAVPTGLPDRAVVEAVRVAFMWNVINRLANAFDFQLRPGQLEKGTRSLHRFGYRFPRFVTGSLADTAREGLVDQLRHAVLEAPARTAPQARQAAASGGPLPEPLATYTTNVRNASYRIQDADVERLAAAGYTEDAIYELTFAAAVGAAMACWAACRYDERERPT
jgi:AhpD family alkylhydroperoxidase